MHYIWGDAEEKAKNESNWERKRCLIFAKSYQVKDLCFINTVHVFFKKNFNLGEVFMELFLVKNFPFLLE